MKRLLFPLMLFAAIRVAAQQSDTLYTISGNKIPCKIFEITEYEIRYRVGGPDGTMFVLDKLKLRKYTLANGYSETLLPDEMSVENTFAPIIKNREVLKFQPYGLAFNHVSFAYEKVIKVGMNLDVEAGYISSDINNAANGSLQMNFNTFHNGAYIKPGLKFFISNDYVQRGVKHSHPLQGTYLKLDLGFSCIKFHDVKASVYASTYNNNNYTSVTTSTVFMTDVTVSSYGGFINIGRQIILGNLLTLDGYAGIGFTGQSATYSNDAFLPSMQVQNVPNSGIRYSSDYKFRVSNYYGWARTPGLGLSFTCGIRLGFIIPNKEGGRKAKVTR